MKFFNQIRRDKPKENINQNQTTRSLLPEKDFSRFHVLRTYYLFYFYSTITTSGQEKMRKITKNI